MIFINWCSNVTDKLENYHENEVKGKTGQNMNRRECGIEVHACQISLHWMGIFEEFKTWAWFKATILSRSFALAISLR